MSFFGILCLAGFIVCVLVQVFSRTFLPTTPSWTEEASKYLFIYMVAFGCSVAVHKKEFVGIDIFASHLSDNANKIIAILMNVLLMVFNLYVLTRSVIKFAFIKFRMVSTALQIPMQYVYFSMVILFGLLSFSYFIEIIYLFCPKNTEEKEVDA